MDQAYHSRNLELKSMAQVTRYFAESNIFTHITASQQLLKKWQKHIRSGCAENELLKVWVTCITEKGREWHSDFSEENVPVYVRNSDDQASQNQVVRTIHSPWGHSINDHARGALKPWETVCKTFSNNTPGAKYSPEKCWLQKILNLHGNQTSSIIKPKLQNNKAANTRQQVIIDVT